MTVRNIVAVFLCTGIYPLDRSIVVPVKAEQSTSLAKHTWLKFIPLYNPAKPRRRSSDVIVFS